MSEPNFQYHPLDGVEILKWILQDAGQKLREFAEFARHRAYHNPKYTLSLTIETYDATGKYVSADQKTPVAGEKATISPDPDGPPIQITPPVASEGPLLTPDFARDAIREGKYQTRKEGGVLCDVKESVIWADFGKKNPDAPDLTKKQPVTAPVPAKKG